MLKSATYLAALALLAASPALAADNRIPVGWSVQLPASTLLLAFNDKCGIEEVAVAKPWAGAGREHKRTGGYLHVCYWQEGGKVYVADQLGKIRALPFDALQPVMAAAR